MNIQNLEKWMKKIKVTNMVNADVEVVNNSPLVMMGKGRQGAVFQLTNDICVKVFGNTEDCDREYYALSLGQQTTLFPKLYGKGPLYIVMEIIQGVDLREYLQSQPLTKALSAKLIEMLVTFKKIGYERIDHHKRQIYLQPDGSLKVIDVARTIWRDRVYPYPRKLLTSLGEKNKAIFLAHVQELAPELYAEWLHYIHMEEISRQITALLLPQEPDKNKIKNISNTLLTTADEKNYVTKLQGLVHKVFKEEWVKAMLARGVDPEAVMAKIDEHWDQLEQNYAERYPEGESDYGGVKRFEGDRHSKGDREYRGGKHFEGDRDRRSKGAKGAKGAKGGRHFTGDRYETQDRYDEKRDKKKDKKKDKDKNKKGR
jgi:predicted Ser/Thr protein kinase